MNVTLTQGTTNAKAGPKEEKASVQGHEEEGRHPKGSVRRGRWKCTFH